MEGQATRGCRPACACLRVLLPVRLRPHEQHVCVRLQLEMQIRQLSKYAIYIYNPLRCRHAGMTRSQRPSRRWQGSAASRTGVRRSLFSAGSISSGGGVGQEGQKRGFPCLMSQQGHCPRGPAPDSGEGLGVGWCFLARLPSPASPGGAWQQTLSRIGRERSQLWLWKGLSPPRRGQPVLLGQLLRAHGLKLQPGGIKGGHSGKFLHVGGWEELPCGVGYLLGSSGSCRGWEIDLQVHHKCL